MVTCSLFSLGLQKSSYSEPFMPSNMPLCLLLLLGTVLRLHHNETILTPANLPAGRASVESWLTSPFKPSTKQKTKPFFLHRGAVNAAMKVLLGVAVTSLAWSGLEVEAEAVRIAYQTDLSGVAHRSK